MKGILRLDNARQIAEVLGAEVVDEDEVTSRRIGFRQEPK